MKNTYSVENIKINYDIETHEYPPFVLEKMEEFYYKAQKKNIPWKTVEDLKDLIKRFPNVPQFKNYLAKVYEVLKKKDFMRTISEKTVKDHPDYIFGRISLADFYLLGDGDVELAEKVLNNAQNISEIIPEKNNFHITEVFNFYKVRFNIELKKKNYENATQIIDLLDREMDDDEIYRMRMQIMAEKMDDDDFNFFNVKEDAIEPTPIKTIEKDTEKDKPKLENPLLYELYTEKNYIDEDIVNKIFALDRNSAINDLVKILKDTEKRYHFYINLADEFDKFDFFPIHALWFLKEFEAEEALDDILNFLRNDDAFLELWLGDYLTENAWEFVYATGKNQLPKLKNFLLEPGIYGFAKSAVMDAILQVSLRQPEKKQQIVELLKECIVFFNGLTEEDNIISTNFFSGFVSDLIELNKNTFKSEVKKMFDKNWIDESFCGGFEELISENFPPQKRELTNLKTHYRESKRGK